MSINYYLAEKKMKILEDICKQYSLGALECPPVQLKGGFLHKMYALYTEKGRYAVKLLNPHIMQRDTAMENYRRAEELERLLEENRLPIIPALQFEGRKMQNMGVQYRLQATSQLFACLCRSRRKAADGSGNSLLEQLRQIGVVGIQCKTFPGDRMRRG